MLLWAHVFILHNCYSKRLVLPVKLFYYCFHFTLFSACGYRHIRFIASPGFAGFHSRCPLLVTCPRRWWGTRDHSPVSFPTPCLNEIQHTLPYKIHNNCSEIGSKSHLAISPGTPNSMKCFWITTYFKMAAWIHTAPSCTRVLAPHRVTSFCFYHICKTVLPLSFLSCPQ